MRRPGKGGAGDRGTLKDGKKGGEGQEGVKVEKTLKKRRVDDFHTGFVGKLRPPSFRSGMRIGFINFLAII